MKKCVLNLVNNTVYSIQWIIGTEVAEKAANTDNFISLVSRVGSLIKFSSFAVLELGCWGLRLFVVVDVLRHLPDLHDVVL